MGGAPFQSAKEGGGGSFLGVSIFNYESPPMSCLQWLDASEATNWTIWSQVLTAHNTLNSTMSGIACNARHNYLHPSTQSCPCNNLWWRSFLSHMWTAFETVLLTTPWVCSISHVKLMGAHSSKLWPHTDTGNCVENRRWALFCETAYGMAHSYCSSVTFHASLQYIRMCL